MFDSIFKTIYLIGLCAGGIIRARYTKGRWRDMVTDDWKTGMDILVVTLTSLGLIIPLLYLFTPWLDFADYRLPTWAGWLGAPVFALALWLLWRAHAELGRQWSNYARIKEEHTLIKSGVYRCIRHPMYAAHCHWGIAQAWLLWNWVAGLGMLAAYIPIYVIRVPREERMLLKHFGDEYQRYMHRTGRIIPRVCK